MKLEQVGSCPTKQTDLCELSSSWVSSSKKLEERPYILSSIKKCEFQFPDLIASIAVDFALVAEEEITISGTCFISARYSPIFLDALMPFFDNGLLWSLS